MKWLVVLFLLVGCMQVGCLGEDPSHPSASPQPTRTPVAKAPNEGHTVEKAIPSLDGFQKGVNIRLYGNDKSFGVKFERLLNRLVGDNVTSISLVIPLYQERWDSSEVTTFEDTPSDEIVASAIRMAHEHGLTVMVRPLIDEMDIVKTKGMWRGEIEPPNLAQWHASYRAFIVHYATIAQQEGAELLCLGVELVSRTEENDLPYWNQLIDEVKVAYQGALTYSQNHNASMDIGFWGRLDFMGIDAFYQLDAPDRPTLEDLTEAWKPHVKELKKLQAKYGKPVLFTEAGSTSEKGSFQQPWVWQHGTGVDLPSHALYYTATCAAARESATGIYFWAVDLDPPQNPEQDTGFDFQGKPSEISLVECYGH